MRKGNLASTGHRPPDPRIKDRLIDPMSGKNSPAKEPEPVFEPWQADGRQPFMPRVSLEPLPFDASLPFCSIRGECDRSLSGALRAPFIQRWGHRRTNSDYLKSNCCNYSYHG
jgi:hypothetical protein